MTIVSHVEGLSLQYYAHDDDRRGLRRARIDGVYYLEVTGSKQRDWLRGREGEVALTLCLCAE